MIQSHHFDKMADKDVILALASTITPVVVVDWGDGVSASCTVGPIVR